MIGLGILLPALFLVIGVSQPVFQIAPVVAFLGMVAFFYLGYRIAR